MSLEFPVFVASWAAWMPAMLIQGSLVIFAVTLTEVAVRRWAWPQLTHALWLLVPAKHLLPPSLFSPFSPGSALTSPAEAALGVSNIGVLGMGLSNSLLSALTVLWACGFLLVASFGLRRQRRLRKILLTSALPAPPAVLGAFAVARQRLGLRQQPRLVMSPTTGSPAVLGLLRPVVVLPQALARRLSPVELEHVLLHELAHVRRGDLWLQALFSLVHWLYWFQPMMPWVVRRAYESRELCCDATVAAVLGEGAQCYRLSLLRSARAVLQGSPWPRPAAAALVAGGGTLERLRWLENGSGRNPRRRRALAMAVFVALAFLVLPMAKESPAVRRARQEVAAAVAGGSSLQVKYSVMALHGLLEEEAAKN